MALFALNSRRHGTSTVAFARCAPAGLERGYGILGESGGNLVTEPDRIAHSSYFPEGRGRLSRTDTHQSQGSGDKNNNEPHTRLPF